MFYAEKIIKMAQAQIGEMHDLQPEGEVSIALKKRKITFNVDTNHYISIFKNESDQTVINIRKGTRSVSISTDMWNELCDLKESVLLCASVIDKR